MTKTPKRKRAPGAGRKPKPEGEKRVSRSFSLAPHTLAWIEGEASASGITPGRVVDGLVPRNSDQPIVVDKSRNGNSRFGV